MCVLEDYQQAKRCKQGRVVVQSNASAFRVRGTLDGVAFDRTFPSVAAWRAYKRLVKGELEVRYMGSENA